MAILVLGINHKTANVSIREKAYFPLDKLTLYLQDLLSRGLAQEAILLSTCNRSELYCVAEDIVALKAWFVEQTTLTNKELANALYSFRNEQAITHMMQVACGLDSMIVGEPEILGQMKAAFSESCTAGAINTIFHRLFQKVFAVAKEIRSNTAIGACPVSVASSAVHIAKQTIANFKNAYVAIIGAGETSSLVCRYLQGQLQAPICLINRSEGNAQKLLAECKGKYVPFSALSHILAEADIIFSATSSPTPIITPNSFKYSRSQPLLMLDLAVPRDIDPQVKQLSYVNLIDIDNLKAVIAKHQQGREHAALKAQEMIGEKSKMALAEIYSLDKVGYTIAAYRSQIEMLCETELFKAKQQLALGNDPNDVLAAFARGFMNKLLHTPSVQLRQAGVEGRHDLLSLAKQLFAIPDPDLELSAHEAIN